MANSDNTDQIFLQEPSDLDYLFAILSLIKIFKSDLEEKSKFKDAFLEIKQSRAVP